MRSLKLQPYSLTVSTLLAIVLIPAMSHAAAVSLTASDPGNTSSLNSAGKWSDGQAPNAANDYFTGAFFARTTPDGNSMTFAGHSLTLQQPSGQGNPQRSLLFKGSGGNVITIDNLTNAAGAVLNNGGSGNVSAPTFTGNLWTIAGDSTILSDQGSTIIGYPLAGTAILTNTSGQSRTITYNGDLSGFSGKFYIFSSCTVALGSGSSAPGNPAAFSPDQIMIGNGCTLLDNVGITFSNSNGGITLLGSGNATISSGSFTVISEPITDMTNGVSSLSSLTIGGGGTVLLNASNNYSGTTTISGGTLQLGNPNAISSSNLTDNGVLDLNSNSITINALNGTGIIDNSRGGSPTLTIGAGGASGTFSGTIQNSGGTLSIVKTGAGTETLAGALFYSGTTVAAGGTLNISSASGVPASPGDLVASSGAVLNGDASSGAPLAAANVTVGANSTFGLIPNASATGLNISGNLLLQDGATNLFNYGSLTANPTAPAINAGSVSAPGSTVYIVVSASGLQPGVFTLIKYSGTLGSIANFQLVPPPGVSATLVNNTANHSIDINITSIPNVLTWYGAGGTNWDLTTVNWKTSLGADSLFQQYTNGSVVAGDAVTFDDSLTNGFPTPQPTNINMTATFFAFPVVVNSALPYSISGPGGITGITSLVKSNSGSLTLLTSNSFTGGVFINDSGSLVITNDSALGASSGGVTLNGGTLQMNGNVTNSRPISMPVNSFINVGAGDVASLGGVINGGAAAIFNKDDAGTLVLTAKENLRSNVFVHNGTLVIDSGGSITNTLYDDVGQANSDVATMVLRGTGSFGTANDFNVGDIDNSAGTLNISNSAVLVANQIFIGSANVAGSTASGVVNQAGGTVTQVSTAVGAFSIGGRTSTSGVGVYNMMGGTLTANAGMRVGGTGIGTLNQSGGTINAKQGINIARIAGSFGTNNLNGGTLATFNIGTSTGQNAVFNFNGGTLQAQFNPPTAWFSGNIQANVLAGGAIVDSSSNNVTISTPLLAGSPNGGLTKKGSGTLTLTGINTFTGPIVNTAGTLILNSASTYPGGLTANVGTTLQLSTANTVTGPTVVFTNAVLSVNQVGSGSLVISNLTLNGSATGAGATIGLAPTLANNPNVPLLSAGVLTLNGTNSINLPTAKVGTVALIKYSGAIAGSGNITNLILPQGASGFVSNDVADSTLFAVITSTGPGLTWTGTNAAAPNVWNISSTTNWLLGTIPTSYHQIIVPGDSVTFDDTGSGTVLLNTSVAPASMVISNNGVTYTFSGSGSISGPTGLEKLGSGTAVLNLTNNSYLGDTVISNGTLQVANTGVGATLPPAGNLTIGPSGTLQLSAQSANAVTTIGEFNGEGVIDYNGGINSILSFGGNNGGTWNGTIRDHNGGGLSLTKNGSGTYVIGGTNHLNNGDFFNAVSQVQFNNGTTILTNGGVLSIPFDEFWVGSVAGSTGTVVVAGGTLSVSNNWIAIGRGDPSANGTLIVNGGTVAKTGNNQIVVGSSGGTGTLIVNGGQILNTADLWLGENATGSGTLFLNGGLVQADVVRGNNAPLLSVANFNGGTLQATTNNIDFLQSTSMILSNGLVLDDGGWAINITSQTLQPGDAFNGGLVKKGAGAVYLDGAETYTGPTVITNGLLAGIGSVISPVVVAPAGSIGGGNNGQLGTFTVNNTIAINGHAIMRINRDSGPTSDSITATGNITYGGSLVISNLSTTTLTTSDTFQLFNAPSHTGNFASIVGTPGPGLAYSFNPASGVLSIVTSTINTNPTNITFQAGGGNLTLSWPADHTGWTLQSNGVSLLDSNAWFDYPAATGSRDVDQVVIPLTNNTNVFFRLKLPQ